MVRSVLAVVVEVRLPRGRDGRGISYRPHAYSTLEKRGLVGPVVEMRPRGVAVGAVVVGIELAPVIQPNRHAAMLSGEIRPVLAQYRADEALGRLA